MVAIPVMTVMIPAILEPVIVGVPGAVPAADPFAIVGVEPVKVICGAVTGEPKLLPFVTGCSRTRSTRFPVAELPLIPPRRIPKAGASDGSEAFSPCADGHTAVNDAPVRPVPAGNDTEGVPVQWLPLLRMM